MRRPLAALTITLALTAAAGCGSSGKPESDKTAGPGMSITANKATADDFFRAIAGKDRATLQAALDLVAPKSPARSYLQLVIDGLAAEPATPDSVTADNGTYKLCSTSAPSSCHTFGAIVLIDGKVSDFTVDGKKIRLR